MHVLPLILFVSILALAIAPDAVAQYQVRKPTGAAAQASIAVTGPVAGTTWEKGKRCEITWTSSGIRGSVKVDLINSQGQATTLTRQTLNNGKYSFMLMRTVGDGDYKIRVSTTDGKTVGESPAMVSVSSGSGAPTRPGAGETQTPTSAPSYQPRTTTPVNPATKTPLNVEPDQSSGLTVGSSAGTSPGELSEREVVRHEISAVQATTAHIEYIEAASAEELRALSATLPTTLGGVLAVSAPVADAEWVAGETYPIEWASADLDGDVKIDLVSRASAADRVAFPLVARTENDGVFECLVPPGLRCSPWNFRVQVASIDERAEAYSSRLSVYSEPVDMTCKIVNLKRKWDTDCYIVYEEDKEWLEFDICLRNNGTQPSVTVQTVSVVIIKEPEELVVHQEEWGFGNIYPRLWYQTPKPRKFDIRNFWVDAIFRSGENVAMEDGAYRVEITVDPHNRLGEDPTMREDNKTVRRFILGNTEGD